MKIEWPKIDWKKLGVFGIVVYFLSLPVAIWRSFHIGRAISIFVILIVYFWGIGKASDLYFGKFRYRMAVDAKMKPLNAQIQLLSDDIEHSRSDLKKSKEQYDSSVEIQNEKERQRFYDDLKEIGFKVTAEREGSAMIYGNQWGYAPTGRTIQMPYRSQYATSSSVVLFGEKDDR